MTGTANQVFNCSYTYDPLNRLSTLASPSDPTGCTGLSWSYDPWGNRTDQTVTAGTCNTFHSVVGANNHLNGFSYDAAGNMIPDTPECKPGKCDAKDDGKK